MVKILQQNVPMCPVCGALMKRRHYGEHTYFICADCKAIWKVLDGGQAEIELVITDNAFDVVYDFYTQGHRDGEEMVKQHIKLYKEEIDDGR